MYLFLLVRIFDEETHLATKMNIPDLCKDLEQVAIFL